MIKHKIVTEGLLRKEEGTNGVGVFKIEREPLSAYTSTHIDFFVGRVSPNEFPQDAQGYTDSYLTALELSGDMDASVLLALNCKKVGLLKKDTSLLYKVEPYCDRLLEPKNTINVRFKSLPQGSGRYDIAIHLPEDEFVGLKIASEFGLLLEITEEALIFYYNTMSYFTHSNLITIMPEDLENIRKSIELGSYEKEESLAHKLEPEYMKSITLPHRVFWGVNIGTGHTTDYRFNLGGNRIQVDSKLPLGTAFNLIHHNPPILLVLDDNNQAAIYY